MRNAIVEALRNYATFTGRATRREFWSLVLVMLVFTVGARYIDLLDGEITPVAAGMGVTELCGFLFFLLPTISAGSRRLHDADRSAWWLLFFYVPYLSFVATKDNEQLNVAAAAAFLVGAFALIIQLCIAGHKGENRYGADPRAITGTNP
jgi:uncharacterized membrane protein YhaH (DUF805 family)